MWCPPRGPRRPIWHRCIPQNRRISTEVHQHNLLKVRSPLGGGALIEAGAVRSSVPGAARSSRRVSSGDA